MPKVKATRGIRWPKKKAMRDAIRAGEATSADVGKDEWERLRKRGDTGILPSDMIPDFNERGAIKREA